MVGTWFWNCRCHFRDVLNSNRTRWDHVTVTEQLSRKTNSTRIFTLGRDWEGQHVTDNNVSSACYSTLSSKDWLISFEFLWATSRFLVMVSSFIFIFYNASSSIVCLPQVYAIHLWNGQASLEFHAKLQSCTYSIEKQQCESYLSCNHARLWRQEFSAHEEKWYLLLKRHFTHVDFGRPGKLVE